MVGNDHLLHKEKIAHDTCDVSDAVLHGASNDFYIGHITILNVIKEDAKEAIDEMLELP